VGLVKRQIIFFLLLSLLGYSAYYFFYRSINLVCDGTTNKIIVSQKHRFANSEDKKETKKYVIKNNVVNDSFRCVWEKDTLFCKSCELSILECLNHPIETNIHFDRTTGIVRDSTKMQSTEFNSVSTFEGKCQLIESKIF
jgi:hypothetical protein